MKPNSQESICIIPAKGSSERLPRKNLKLLGGKPLVAHTIECALRAELFDEVVVSTEDEMVAAVAQRFGARIPYRRPEALAANCKGVADVCIDLLRHLEDHDARTFRTTYILLPTSPFRRPENLREASAIFHSRPNARALMSVTELECPPFWAFVDTEDGFVKRLYSEDVSGKRRHELPKSYMADGNLMIFDTASLIEKGNYEFPEIIPYFTPTDAALDINLPIDFAFAEFLLMTRDCNAA